jgi:hypothetical protein
MSTPLCADRCELVADLAAGLARATGVPERAERVALGLTPVFVPPIPVREPVVVAPYRCAACGKPCDTFPRARACEDRDNAESD